MRNEYNYRDEVDDANDIDAGSSSPIQWWRWRWWPSAHMSSSSSCSSSSPIIANVSSPAAPLFFVPLYIEALFAAILAIAGFICIWIATLSCQFLAVSYSYNYQIYSTNNNDASISDKTNNIIHGSIGIFCNNNDANRDDTGVDTMLTLSKIFTCLLLLLSAVLSSLTIGICTTFLSPSMISKLWNGTNEGNDNLGEGSSSRFKCGGDGSVGGLLPQMFNISYLSAITFVFHLPVLFVLDSHPCKNNALVYDISDEDIATFTSTNIITEISPRCTLGVGSIPLFLSMGMHLVVTIYAYCKDCPDWREEYELWKLMKQKKKQRQDDSGVEETTSNSIDEEHGAVKATTIITKDELLMIKYPANDYTTTLRYLPENEFEKLDDQSNQVLEEVKSGRSHVTYNTNDSSHPTPSSPLPPPPPLLLPLGDGTMTNIANDLDTSILTTLVTACSSAEEKKQQLSQLLREERVRQKKEKLHTLAAPSYSSGKLRINDVLPLHNQYELPQEHSSSYKPPLLLSIHINRKVEKSEETTNADTTDNLPFAVDTNAHSEPVFMVDELEWPTADDTMNEMTIKAPCSVDSSSSPLSIRMKIMKDSSPLTKFSDQLGDNKIYNYDTHQAIPSESGSTAHDVDVGAGAEIVDEKYLCKTTDDDETSKNSLIPDKYSTHHPVIRDSISTVAPSVARIVSPEKEDHDPDIDVYPSDGSLSSLSLETDIYHTIACEDDDYDSKYPSDTPSNVQHTDRQPQERDDQQRWEHQSQEKNDPLNTIPKKDYVNFVSDGYSSEDSELSAVIAGVQKLNRKTSGKITPLNKRRRRRRKGNEYGPTLVSSISANSLSSHGSLLDEIIVEESELNLSNEEMVAATTVNVVDYMHEDDYAHHKQSMASKVDAPSSTVKKKKKKRRRRRRRKKKDGRSKEINDDGCYECHDACLSIRSDSSSSSDDSTSSRSARGRRNRRIVMQRQSRNDTEGDYDSSSSVSSTPIILSPPSDGLSVPSLLVYRNNRKDVNKDRGINNRPSPLASVNGNNSQVDQIAWRVREVRMKRLRMARVHDNGVIISSTRGDSGSSSSDGDADVDDFEGRTTMDAPENEIITRFHSRVIISSYSSDEDSI